MSAFRALLVVLLLAPSAPAADAPFDVIERAYAPYMSPDDPLAFPMKVRSLAGDPYKFWRGSKDLFFAWCKTSAADWLADAKAFLPNHGDLHLGNIGTYASEGGWNRLSFGMVDFDDSAVLPFQIELLQGLITLELTAQQNKIPLDEAASAKLAQTLFDSYRVSVNSRRTATAILADEQNTLATAMLGARTIAYSREVQDYTAGGRFRGIILSEKNKPKELLDPAMQRADEMAAGLAQAIENEPDLKTLFRYTAAADVRRNIKDIARRTRLASSGSQGLKKYFILLARPLRGIDQDVIIYLKQEIPSAAERSGAVPRASLTPGQRVKRDMDRLTEPRPYLNSWCDIGGESYWVSFKEPWGQELDPENVKAMDQLLDAARIWGIVAGATHREEGRFETILPRLTVQLQSQIRHRSRLFVAKLHEDFTLFKSDPRVDQLIIKMEAAVQMYGRP